MPPSSVIAGFIPSQVILLKGETSINLFDADMLETFRQWWAGEINDKQLVKQIPDLLSIVAIPHRRKRCTKHQKA